MWADSSAAQVKLPPFAVSPEGLTNLGLYVRDIYRLQFRNELAKGSLKPLVVPYSLLGTFILPILYFSVSHVDRPWLFRARYLLMLFILVFNFSEASGSSSANFAVAYGVGLMQAWGIMWSAVLLIWTNPQFEAERVEKRKRVVGAEADPITNPSANGHVENSHAKQNGHPLTALDGTVEPSKPDTKAGERSQILDAPDEDIARSLKEGYEYYWQAYPADAPFSTRFDWSVDLVLSFRGTGWNWGVPVLPRFAKSEKPLCGMAVDLNSIPLCTRQGFRRYRTSREWLRAKLGPMILSYFALDLLSVLMMKDPYFVLGPEYINATTTSSSAPLSLPPLLANLPTPLLFLYRSLVCCAAILLAIDLIMTCYQLFAHLALRRLLGTRSELWHFPCTNGSFTYSVLDKGMAGFWGSWWHQTFRVAFSAPGVWLSRKGHIDPRSARGKAIAGLMAFALSGFLHSLGSISCLPPSKPFLPPVFFLLCWVGVLVQTAGCALLRGAGVTKKLPVWARRAGNFAFVFVWLNATQFFLSDDLARAGIWMLEPVPISLFRAMGLGKPGDSWWRWDSVLWPRWWVGRVWWESGIAL